MPYSTAWRTSTLLIAPPEFGLRRLNTTYGKMSVKALIEKFGFFAASRPGRDGGLIDVSIGRSWLPACMSVSWVWAEVTPSVTATLETYWCRSVSVDCFQAVFRARLMDLPGRYEVILYGPSDTVCWSSCGLFGK